MIRYHQLLLCLCLACLIPLQVSAEAPVVDESENFAIFDDQQAATERPVAKAQLAEDSYSDDEVALAHDRQDFANSDTAELINKIQGLQQDIQELRGQLEVQSHDLKLLQQQQLAFYKDLDARVRNTPSKETAQLLPKDVPQELTIGSQIAATNPVSKQVPVEKQANAIRPEPAQSLARNNPADEQISYLAAYDLVKNKRFDEALMAMHHFVSQYPQGGYTANAQYWLGELYLVKNNYPKAIEHFEMVLNQFPSSSKAAASTLKIGYALAASGRNNEARLRLQQVLKNYPDTPTAQLAAIKLETLGVS